MGIYAYDQLHLIFGSKIKREQLIKMFSNLLIDDHKLDLESIKDQSPLEVFHFLQKLWSIDEGLKLLRQIKNIEYIAYQNGFFCSYSPYDDDLNVSPTIVWQIDLRQLPSIRQSVTSTTSLPLELIRIIVDEYHHGLSEDNTRLLKMNEKTIEKLNMI